MWLNHRKGQITSGDFVLASILFLSMVLFMALFWFVMLADVGHAVEKDVLEATAIPVSDLLLKTPGTPPHWEEDPENVEGIGLVSSQNILAEGKLGNFTGISYEDAKETMGLSEEFYFYVEDFEGNRLHETGNSTIGDQAISLTRFALLNGEKVRMRLIIHG